MKRLTVAALLLASFTGAGCITSHDPLGPVLQGPGTIRYSALEGGFYLIVADDGHQFDPIRLDPQYRQDGLRVHFVVRPRPEAVSSHMVAPIVDVLKIEPLKNN